MKSRSHGSIFSSPLGDDVEKIGHFQRGESRSHGSNVFASPLGGDVEKIDHFQRETTALEVTPIFQSNI